MSEQNVELVRRAYAHTLATGQAYAEGFAPDFVWDMSRFEGWPEQQRYVGADGAQRFLDDSTGAWEDWGLETHETHDVGEKVVWSCVNGGRQGRPASRSTCCLPKPGQSTPAG